MVYGVYPRIPPNTPLDWRDRKLIWNLYNGQKAYVRIGESGACSIGRGVRQGCSLSPLLFIIYDEAMVKEATSNSEHGVYMWEVKQ